MLPPVLAEGEYSSFNFWMGEDIQQGISYEGEMFCCLCTLPLDYRAQLYHYACRLMKTDSVVITVSDNHCRLWVSLRSPNLGNLKAQCIDEASINEILELPID